MGNTVTVESRYMSYNKDDVQHLLDEVKNRSFFRDMTEEQYEALPKAQKENGDLYLIYDPEE